MVRVKFSLVTFTKGSLVFSMLMIVMLGGCWSLALYIEGSVGGNDSVSSVTDSSWGSTSKAMVSCAQSTPSTSNCDNSLVSSDASGDLLLWMLSRH